MKNVSMAYFETRKPLFFLLILLAALLGQSLIWLNFEYVDKSMWIDQAQFIATKDPRAFDKLVAYGHPGTAVVEIAIIAHYLFGISYEAASNGGLALLNAVAIAGCITLCYALRPKSIWWFVAAGLLIPNRLFAASTPPTAAAIPLILLLFLLTLWLYEQKTATLRYWPVVLWGIVAGVAASSRTDITGVVALPLLLFIAPRIGFKKSALMVALAALTFYITDPFMWARPLAHFYDLIAETHLHYANFRPSRLSPLAVLLISPLAIISLGLALAFLVWPKKLPAVLPRRFLIATLLITIGISGILLSSQYQAQRYFFPLAILWETFLPLFLLELIARIPFSSLRLPQRLRMRRLVQVVVVTLLIGGQVAMTVHLYLIPQVIFVCSPTANRLLFCMSTTPMVW